jgi:hypothetical protein
MAQPEHVADAAAQMARNDAIFREANERIEGYVQSMDEPMDGLLPFLCECADVRCTDIIRMTSAEYEALRQDPVRFATVPGHEGAGSWAEVVDQNDRFAIVQKVGVAAEVAKELDARRRT